jgi:hypothetical protein
MNKLKRQLFCYIAIAARNHCDCLAGDKLQQDIYRWLCPPDPWKIITLSGNRTTLGLQRGSFKATRSQNGEFSSLDPRKTWVGAYIFAKADGFPFRSGLRKECALVR